MKLNIRTEALFEKPEYDDGGNDIGSQELVYALPSTRDQDRYLADFFVIGMLKELLHPMLTNSTRPVVSRGPFQQPSVDHTFASRKGCGLRAAPGCALLRRTPRHPNHAVRRGGASAVVMTLVWGAPCHGPFSSLPSSSSGIHQDRPKQPWPKSLSAVRGDPAASSCRGEAFSDIDASDRAMEPSLMCPANPAGRTSTTTQVHQVVLAEGNSLFGTIDLFVACQHAAFSAWTCCHVELPMMVAKPDVGSPFDVREFSVPLQEPDRLSNSCNVDRVLVAIQADTAARDRDGFSLLFQRLAKRFGNPWPKISACPHPQLIQEVQSPPSWGAQVPGALLVCWTMRSLSMNGNQSGGQSIPTHGLLLQTGFQIENFPSWDRAEGSLNLRNLLGSASRTSSLTN